MAAKSRLGEALGPIPIARAALFDLRRGKNTWYLPTGLFRQSLFDRLADYGDVKDAERLSPGPTTRAAVDCKGLERSAAPTSKIGPLKTERLATNENAVVLTDYSGSLDAPVARLRVPSSPWRD